MRRPDTRPHTKRGSPGPPEGAPRPGDAVCVDRMRLSILEEPLAEPVPMSLGTMDARHALLVEVEVGGEWGLGETWVNHPKWACHERLSTFRHGIAPLLAGRDVRDPKTLLTGLAQALMPRAEQGGVSGPVWQAMSGLDLALWDVVSKLEERSIAEALRPGHQSRESVAVYASGIGPTKVEELCSTAAGQGVGAVKARVGFGADVDASTLAAIRDALGDDVVLFADANRAWSRDEAVAMSAILAEYGAAWVEEPLRDDRPEALATLFDVTGLPVAAGENLYGLAAFGDYLTHARLAAVQPDPAKSGGLTTCAAIAQSASAHGVNVYPHCYSSGVALAASIQFAAAFDNVAMVEVDVRASALRTQLLDVALPIVDGKIAVPGGPGLGVAVDPEVRSRYLLAEEEIVLGGAS